MTMTSPSPIDPFVNIRAACVAKATEQGLSVEFFEVIVNEDTSYVVRAIFRLIPVTPSPQHPSMQSHPEALGTTDIDAEFLALMEGASTDDRQRRIDEALKDLEDDE